MASDTPVQDEQLALVQRLQLKWLKHMDTLFDSGEITSTDLATLARLLSQNGWSLDPARLPKNLKDKLTKHVDFDADEDGQALHLVA